MQKFDSTIRCLARRWSGARLLLPGFPLLAKGKPLTVAEIAGAAGVDDHEVENALGEARCTFNKSGQVIDLFGMMLAPTYHRLEIAPDKVQSVSPGTALATLAVADAASIEQDVGSAFCSHVRYFASSDSAYQHAAGSPLCTVVDVNELHEMAGQLHEIILDSLGDGPSCYR